MKDIEVLRKEARTIKLKEHTLDGKRIAYSSETEFLVQVGRGTKGSYKTKYRIVGDLARAVMYYNGINIGNGYKKRLLMPSCTRKPVVEKQTAFSFLTKKKEKVMSPILTKAAS